MPNSVFRLFLMSSPSDPPTPPSSRFLCFMLILNICFLGFELWMLYDANRSSFDFWSVAVGGIAISRVCYIIRTIVLLASKDRIKVLQHSIYEKLHTAMIVYVICLMIFIAGISFPFGTHLQAAALLQNTKSILE